MAAERRVEAVAHAVEDDARLDEVQALRLVAVDALQLARHAVAHCLVARPDRLQRGDLAVGGRRPVLGEHAVALHVSLRPLEAQLSRCGQYARAAASIGYLERAREDLVRLELGLQFGVRRLQCIDLVLALGYMA